MDHFGKIQITKKQYIELQKAHQAGAYTQYHYLKSQAGSVISKLYIAGPTGQGVFGSLSHNYTQDFIGSEVFLNRQKDISKTIIDLEIIEIGESFDGNYYYLPDTRQTLENEIKAWEKLDLKPESYAGQQLIAYLNIDNVEGAINVNMALIVDDLASAVAKGLAGHFINPEYDDFTYKGKVYTSADLIQQGEILFVKEQGELIPVGVTNGGTLNALTDLAYVLEIEQIIAEEGLEALKNNPLAQKYIELLEQRELRCFSAGTLIDMADGTRKPIEQVEVGDEVLAYDPEVSDGLSTLKTARVTQTMINVVDEIIDFHGVQVTPGHATLCTKVNLQDTMYRSWISFWMTVQLRIGVDN